MRQLHSKSLSCILRTKENSAPADTSNNRPESLDRVTRLSGPFSERNYSETLQARIYNFLSFGDYVPCNLSTNQTSANFAYDQGTGDNSTQAEAPKSNASPSSAVIQDTPALSTTISRFVPNSRLIQSRMTISGENNILAPLPVTTNQYKSDSIAIPHFQTDSKETQNLEHFFPSTARSKLFFALNPAAYIQNTKNEFSASADESAITKSNASKLFETYTTTHEEEAGPENISFTGTTLMKEDSTAKTDATDILEDYTTLLDVPDMKDKHIILTNTTYLERYGKTVSNAPDLPQKDNSIIINATDMKNHGRTTVNAQKTNISSAKNSNDFRSIPNLSTYNKADTKSIMIASNIDETISNINPINTTNSFLNYIMYKKSNNVISNSNDTKTI